MHCSPHRLMSFLDSAVGMTPATESVIFSPMFTSSSSESTTLSRTLSTIPSLCNTFDSEEEKEKKEEEGMESSLNYPSSLNSSDLANVEGQQAACQSSCRSSPLVVGDDKYKPLMTSTPVSRSLL